MPLDPMDESRWRVGRKWQAGQVGGVLKEELRLTATAKIEFRSRSGQGTTVCVCGLLAPAVRLSQITSGLTETRLGRKMPGN